MSAAEAEVHHLVTNPWAGCEACGDVVTSRTVDRNFPCRCRAAMVSVCPTWTPADGCVCSTADAADRFQELLEPGDAAATLDRGASALDEADDWIRSAEQWRPGRVAWILFVMAAALVYVGLQSVGFGW